jgi:hypothetical protein
MHRTVINVPQETSQRARIKAVREGTNVSEVIRHLLARWVSGEVRLDAEESSREKLVALALIAPFQHQELRSVAPFLPRVLFEHPHQVFQLQDTCISDRGQERAHIGDDLLPVNCLESVSHHPSPIVCCQRFSIPARLLQGIVEQSQVWCWPPWIAEIPQQVIDVTAFGVRSLENGVDLACQERGSIVMLKL